MIPNILAVIVTTRMTSWLLHRLLSSRILAPNSCHLKKEGVEVKE